MFFSDEQLHSAIQEFKVESLELLSVMEDGLLEIQEKGMDLELINSVFRSAHTIKGSAGMLNLEHLVRFTHVVENILDEARNGTLVLTEKMLASLLKCKDHMQTLVLFYAESIHQTPDSSLQTISQLLMEELQESPSPEDEPTPALTQEVSMPIWKIRIEFGEELFLSGMDPINFLRFLYTKGTPKSIVLDEKRIASLHAYDPLKCAITVSLELETSLRREEIMEVFEFIQEDIVLSLELLTSERGVEMDAEEESAHESSKPSARVPSQNGSTSAESNLSMVSNSLRVDSDKIDILINLIGEMVIANANVVQKSGQMNDDALIESVSIVSHMLEEVRESAMKIRMVQIGDTFNKFKRIIHDVSKQLGKDVELVVNGGDTEMDKTIVEKISDPLIHIVRNALDHGLETPEERLMSGKKQKGRLELNAFHDAGTIAIQVIDDGKGLNEEKILAKAIEKGLIDPAAKLTQKEIFNLIFEPGFSTAAEVTNLSGRGVGMDVVRKNIQSLRGTVDIQSELGKGSTFTIRLPLTLAIIDGFLVRVGKTHYVIPLEMVLECVELPENHRETMNGNDYINLRGNILTILSLRDFFKEKAPRISRDKENVVVVRSGENRFGLIVEELLGEFQTVIKPLGKIFRGLKGIGGSAILGSGEVALIVDVPALNGTISDTKNHLEKGA